MDRDADDVPAYEWTRPPRSARVVLGIGIVVGLAFLANLLVNRPHMVGANFRVFRVAAEAAVAGENFYAVAPDRFPHFRYLYPPVTVVAFYPSVLVDWEVGYAVHLLGTVAVGATLGVVLARLVESRGVRLDRVDRALMVAWLVVGVHATPSLVFGQVNHHLLALLVVGFLSLERDEEPIAGAAFALAALVKLFPAIAGIWLLRRRAWRAVGAAVATGLGLLGAGVVAFGVDLHRVYVEEALLPRREHEAFAGGLDPTAGFLTLRRPISHLLPGVDPGLYGPLAVAVVAPVVGYLYLDVDGPLDRLVAVFATVSAMILVVPSALIYALYLAFPMVPLLYLLEGEWARRLFVAGALVSSVAVTGRRLYADPSTLPLPEVVLDGLGLVLTFGKPPLYGIALMLAGCVVYARRRRRA